MVDTTEYNIAPTITSGLFWYSDCATAVSNLVQTPTATPTTTLTKTPGYGYGTFYNCCNDETGTFKVLSTLLDDLIYGDGFTFDGYCWEWRSNYTITGTFYDYLVNDVTTRICTNCLKTYQIVQRVHQLIHLL